MGSAGDQPDSKSSFGLGIRAGAKSAAAMGDRVEARFGLGAASDAPQPSRQHFFALPPRFASWCAESSTNTATHPTCGRWLQAGAGAGADAVRGLGGPAEVNRQTRDVKRRQPRSQVARHPRRWSAPCPRPCTWDSHRVPNCGFRPVRCYADRCHRRHRPRDPPHRTSRGLSHTNGTRRISAIPRRNRGMAGDGIGGGSTSWPDRASYRCLDGRLDRVSPLQF